MNENPTNISTKKELNNVIESKIINENIIISGQNIKTLGSLEKVNGFLGLSNSNLENLGELKYIQSDFWINSYYSPSNLKSLGKLEFVGGEMNLRYSNLENLGKLKKVEGKLSLRDTKIEDIGQLEYVGGDLFLPKRIKDKIDFSKVTIKGNVKFWNDKKKIKTPNKKSVLNLIEYSKDIPNWNHRYIYSFNELKDANFEQLSFYNTYKELFFKEEFIDIKGNDNYTFILYFDIIKTFKNNFELLKKYFKNLEKNYPITESYINSYLIEQFEENKDFEYSWKLILNQDYIGINKIIEYENKLNREILNGEFVIKLGGYSHLTNFGQNNINNIKPYVDKQIIIYKKGRKFFDIFLKNGLPFKLKKPVIIPLSKNIFKTKDSSVTYEYHQEYYKQFYLTSKEYELYKSIDDSQLNPNYQNPMPHVVEKAIFNQFRLILKQAEDLYREDIGMPKIGEGWVSETELFYKISESFPKFKVISHASPKWLGRQHLDIYFPDFNIGIEYQGIQHYKAIDFFGGQEGLEKTIERDKRKRLLCKENDCKLILVEEGYDYEDVRKKLEMIIKNGVQQRTELKT